MITRNNEAELKRQQLRPETHSRANDLVLTQLCKSTQPDGYPRVHLLT
jgi:hypothetical protein